jgi:polyisoprenyl-teichoic acid--peptidoglycan teichoic acid transferase
MSWDPPRRPGARAMPPDDVDADGASGATGAPPPRPLVGLLSAILPGLGHAAAGRMRLAAFFLVPVLMAVGFIIGTVAVGGSARFVATLANPTVLVALLAAQAVLLVWRLAAFASSLADRRWAPPRALDGIVIAVLVVAIIAPQAWAAYVTNVARETVDTVFRPATSTGTTWQPSTTSGPSATATGGAAVSPSQSSGPTPSPTPIPPVLQRRLTVLLIGVDWMAGRQTYLTDTMIVASLDPVARTVSMVSIARDTVDVPLPDGTIYRPKINSLAAFARRNPGVFPGSSGDGTDVLAAAISELLKVKIDYWAIINLPGFVKLIDAVGGVDVNPDHSICDQTYDDFGLRAFKIGAGPHHLDGAHALGYARIRKAAGESDFTRSARQQEVLVSIRDAIVRGGFLGDPVGFLQAVGDTVQTNTPPDLLPDLAGIAQEVPRSRVFQVVIDYPLVRDGPAGDPRGSIQVPDIAGIRELAAALFPKVGTLPQVLGANPASTPRPSRSPGASGSPVATPAPTPRRTPGPDPYCPYLHFIPAPPQPARPTPAPRTPAPTAAPSSAPTSSGPWPPATTTPGDTPIPTGSQPAATPPPAATAPPTAPPATAPPTAPPAATVAPSG